MWLGFFFHSGATENDYIIKRDHLNKILSGLECVKNQFDDACQLVGHWQIEMNTICPTVCRAFINTCKCIFHLRPASNSLVLMRD